MTVGILLAYLCFLFVVAAVAERFGRRRLVARLGWLRLENLRGAHVLIQPHESLRLTLIDDLSDSALELMKQSGFGPALVAA